MFVGSPQRLNWDLLGARILKLQQLSEQIKSAPPFQFVEVHVLELFKLIFSLISYVNSDSFIQHQFFTNR